MIERIMIGGFQRHVGVRLDLHPGVNTIIGESDAGKTSIIRAIRWVYTNRPSTKRIIPHGEKRAKVVLQLDTGEMITRLRSKSDNYYKLSGEPEPFRAIKKGVPEEILKALNLADLNFHLHGSFLLHMTPAARAKYINDLVNLAIVDTTTSNIRRTVEDVKSQHTRTDETIEALEESLTDLEWLDQAGEDLQKLERVYERLVRTGRQHQSLQKIVSDYSEVKEQLKALPTPIPGKTIRALESLLEEIDQTKREADKLGRLIREAKEYWKELKESNKLIEEYEVQFNKLMKGRCPLCGQEVKR